MSAAELRRAAETLRFRAESVMAHNGGDDLWFEADVDLRNAIRGTFLGNKASAPDDARWIALMSPGVGLALADWLDQCADRLDKGHHTGSRHSHRIARLINGGAS